jgi:cysteine-rich repeat protein
LTEEKDMKAMTWKNLGVQKALLALAVGTTAWGLGGCTPECTAGSTLDETTNTCIPDCPTGTTLDDESGECILDCPAGTFRNADGTACAQVLQCGNGFVFDVALQGCVCPPSLEPTNDGTGCVLPAQREPACGSGFVFDADQQGCVCADGLVPTLDGSGCVLPPQRAPNCPVGQVVNQAGDGCITAPETGLIVYGVVTEVVAGQTRPLAGVSVQLRPQGDAPVTTDAFGYYEFTANLEPGTYALQFVLDGFQYAEETFTINDNEIEDHLNTEGNGGDTTDRGDGGIPGTTTLDNFQVSVNVNLSRATTCGDGIIAGFEQCDDGNTANRDGCSSDCNVEFDFNCRGTPSVCVRASELFTVAGTVYVQDRIASGATVLLMQANSSNILARTTTDTAGKFSFANLNDGFFTLRVPGFDEDGDGVLDFGRTDFGLNPNPFLPISQNSQSGNLDTLNLTNLVVTLTGINKQLLATNFLRANGGEPAISATAIGPGDTFNNLRLLNASDNIVMHFGHEVALLGGVLQQIEDGVRVDREIAFELTFNTERTVATINPAEDLTSNVNDNHSFRLILNSFRWSDSDELLRLEQNQTITFNFDIAAAPIAPPASPTPALFFGDLRNPTSRLTATAVQCDEFACWAVDAAGAPVNGFIDPNGANSAANIGLYNEDNGFDLTWTHVPGAVAYRIHARQVNDELSFEDFSAFSEATGTVTFENGPRNDVVPNVQATIHASGVLQNVGVGVRWRDFDRNGFGPLGAGNRVEIAVTSIDVFGNESDIDATRLLTLADARDASILSAAFLGNTATDSARVTELANVFFTENMDTELVPTFTSLAGNTRSATGTFISWDQDGAFGAGVPENTSRAARATFDIRHNSSCSALTCDLTEQDPNRDRLCVADAAAFAVNQDVVLMNQNGATVLDQLSANSDGTVFLRVTAIDATNNLLTVTGINTEMSFGEGALPPELNGLQLFACAVGGVPTAQVFSAATALNDTSFTVTDASGFRVSQGLTLIDRATTPNTVINVTITRLDTTGGTNRITVNAALPVLPAGTIVVARPDIVDRRNATEVELRSIATVSIGGNLALDAGLRGNNLDAQVGDLVLMDVDGDLDTVADTFFARIGDFLMVADNPATATVNEERDEIVLAAAPGFTALPANTVLVRQESVVVFLGDAWSIAGGIADTSGNVDLQPFRRAFASCVNGSIVDAQGDIHCNGSTFGF